MKLLEEMVESANSDKKSAENQLAESLEVIKASEIETTRLKTALDNAKEKVFSWWIVRVNVWFSNNFTE